MHDESMSQLNTAIFVIKWVYSHVYIILMGKFSMKNLIFLNGIGHSTKYSFTKILIHIRGWCDGASGGSQMVIRE